MAETYKILITEDNAEKELTRDDVVEMLHNDVATVTFTKKDGSERVMECTLLQHVLDERAPTIAKKDDPEEVIEQYTKEFKEWFKPIAGANEVEVAPVVDNVPQVKEPNPHTIAVYDIPADGWRSFRLDSIKSIGFPTSIYTDDGIVYPTEFGNPQL